jgi:hypothetical protein
MVMSISCKKIIEIDLPKNQLTDDKVFSDSTNAQAAITGIYINMMQSYSLDFCSGGLTTFNGMSADELNQTNKNINDEFYFNRISSTNSTNSYLWVSAFKYIYGANACIEGIKRSKKITQKQKDHLFAEARFIRAFIYFYLANLYENVPMIAGADYQVNRQLSQSKLEDIYQFIIEDLAFARLHLSKPLRSNIRPHYFAATALLARVYLYQKNYLLAEQMSTEVIDEGGYTLEPTPATVFGGGSKETIWALLPVIGGRATWEGYYHLPPGAFSVPRYVITELLWNSFAENDKRRVDWIGNNTVQGVQYKYINKYKLYAENPNLNERYVMLRLGEQFLIRAESRASLSAFDKAESDINTIRKRAGLESFNSNGKMQSILKEIEIQRRLELMCEWGHRWFDLKRTKRIDEVLSKVKQHWTPSASLYPIPQDELDNNPNLKQNPNY